MQRFENDCGVFTADDEGALISFACRPHPLWRNVKRIFFLEPPAFVRRIPADTFNGYAIGTAVIPSTVRSLGDRDACAFRFCTIRELTLPGDIRIGDRAFFGCSIDALRFSSPPEDLLLRTLGRALHAATWGKELTSSWTPRERAVFEEAFAEPLKTRTLVNETGEFLVDEFGVLRRATLGGVPAPVWNTYPERRVAAENLVLPEGVVLIPGQSLCFLDIKDRLVLPDSLRCVGGFGPADGSLFPHDNAFWGCDVGRLTLPAGLRFLWDYSFAKGRIGELTLSQDVMSSLIPRFGRQFKGTQIGTIRFPVPCAALFSMRGLQPPPQPCSDNGFCVWDYNQDGDTFAHILFSVCGSGR